MIIATSITENYFHKSLSFFDSINKNFEGKRICFCIGFYAIYDEWEMIYVDINSLQCKWQPNNRDNYYSLQHGEFINYYQFKDDDQIMFVDSDIILQREFKTDLIFSGKFLVSNSSFPPTKIIDVLDNLKFEGDKEEFLSKYNLTINNEEFCAALMIGNYSQWKVLFTVIKNVYQDFLSNFKHHAAWQLLINIVIIKHFKYNVISPMIHNAEWYSGTEAKNINNVLMWKNEIVYFNHTKFNGEWKY